MYPSEMESPMIRQFLNSGFTPKGGPGLHTRDALRTSISVALGGDDLEHRDGICNQDNVGVIGFGLASNLV